MASEVADLWVKLSLMSQGFTDGLGKAGAEGEGFSSKIGKMGKDIGIAGVGLAVVAVKMAGDWQASMIKLTTSAGEAGTVINGKLSGPIADVSDKLLKMAVSTATSTKELADGMYFVESAGFHGAAGIKVMQAAAEGAKAEGAQLATVSNALTTALHDMGMNADQSVPMMNMMIRAVGAGKMTMEEFAGSLHSVLPQARAAGISFPDVAAAIATMTVAGTSADQATQMLGHTIQSLQSPNATAVKAMETFGLTTMNLKEHLGDRGLLGTMGLVDKAILDHMGPDGRFLQNTFNTSKAAAQDLNEMLGKMPPTLKKWATEVVNGTISTKDYEKIIKDLPPNLTAMGSQFLTVYKNASSFNNSLRSGAPDADTFAGSLRKILGDTVDTNTALQIGGLNLKTFAETEKNVADGAKNAGDHIETWGTITKGFNFRMDQAKEAIATTGIRVGTVLLPKLMDLFDLIVKKGSPVLQGIEKDFRNALNSPAVHEAESIIGEFWRNFVKFMMDAKTSVENLWHVVEPFAAFVADTFFVAMKAIGLVFANVVGPAIVAVTGFLKDHAGIIKTIAEVVLPLLIARLLIFKGLDAFTSMIKGIQAAVLWIAALNKSMSAGQILDGFKAKIAVATTAVKDLGTQSKVAAAGQGVGGLVGNLGKLMMGGAIVTGVVLGAQSLANWINNIGKKAKDATADLTDMSNKLLDVAGGSQETAQKLAGLAMTAMHFGGSIRDQMIHPIDMALASLVQSGNITQAKQALAGIDAQLIAAGQSADTFNNSLQNYNDQVGVYNLNQRSSALATKDSTTAVDSNTTAVDSNTTSLDGQAGAAGGATDAMNGFTTSVTNAMNKQQDMSAGMNADRAMDDYHKAIDNVKQALKDNGTVLDGYTDKSMANRDAIRAAVQAMMDNYTANGQLGDTAQVATGKLKKQVDEFINSATQSDAARVAIRKYIDGLNMIPTLPPIVPQVDISGAMDKISRLQNKLNQMAGGDTGSLPTPPPSNKKGLPSYGVGGMVDAPRGAPQLAIVHGGEYVVSLDEMNDSDYSSAGGGLGMQRGAGTTVNLYVQGSVVSERDLRDLVQSLMLQLGARYSSSYTPYKR